MLPDERQMGSGGLDLACPVPCSTWKHGHACPLSFACHIRSENIAQAMQVRGFQGPEQQTLYMMRVNKTSVVANVMAIALLGGFFALIGHYK